MRTGEIGDQVSLSTQKVNVICYRFGTTLNQPLDDVPVFPGKLSKGEHATKMAVYGMILGVGHKLRHPVQPRTTLVPKDHFDSRFQPIRNLKMIRIIIS